MTAKAHRQPQQEAGFYEEQFTHAELADLDRALGQSLQGDISMLRVVSRRFFVLLTEEAEDVKQMALGLNVLGLTCTRLAKLIQTERSLQDKRADELGDALSKSMAAIMEEFSSTTLNTISEAGSDGG